MSVLTSCFTAFYDEFLGLPPPSELDCSKSTSSLIIATARCLEFSNAQNPLPGLEPHLLQQTRWKLCLLCVSDIVSIWFGGLSCEVQPSGSDFRFIMEVTTCCWILSECLVCLEFYRYSILLSSNSKGLCSLEKSFFLLILLLPPV